MDWLKTVAIVVLVATFFGCATTITTTSTPGKGYRVEIDAINNGATIKDKSYYIAPADKSIDPADLTYLEYAKIIERALLARQGYLRKESLQKVAVVIAIAYGIGEPKDNVYSYSVPIYGETGVASSYTYENTTTYVPRYGVTGYSTQVETYMTYRRYALVMAYDNKAKQMKGTDVQLWKTDIVSVGYCGDLRRVFPYMISAAMPYFGANTQTRVTSEIAEDAPEVFELRGVVNPNQSVTPGSN